jgi:PAS domain S-box-containing protein
MFTLKDQAAVTHSAVVVDHSSRSQSPRLKVTTAAWEWNTLDGEVSYSPHIPEILGITPDRCPPELSALRTGIHPDDRDRVWDTVSSAVDARRSFETTYRLTSGDGRIRWIESRADILVDSQGRADRFVGTITDVTTREETAQPELEREPQFRELLELLPAAIYTTDAQGHITFFNPAAADLWGRRPELGSDQWCGAQRLYWPDGKPMKHEESPTAVSLREKRPMPGQEIVAERPDGTRVPYIALPTLLHDASGTLLGAVNLLVDVSQRKEIEENCARHLREVETLNARLQRTMAETHHRVKNNLQLVSAMIDMMACQADGPIAPENVRALITHIRALAIVHDLLTHGAKGVQDVQTVSSQDILSQLLPLLEQASSGHSIRYEVEDLSLPIRAATSLALVTNELVQNGIRYGRRCVYVGLSATPAAATLSVRDDGPGFPEGFDPSTLETTGLELVRSLSRWDLAGCVEFANQERGGAIVTVTFPLCPSQA